MQLKRNLMLLLTMVMMIAGTITVYAANTAKTSTKNLSLDAGVTLQAYTYIDESGFGRHIARGTGTLMGEHKAAAGKFRVEVYFGKYEPEKKAHATVNIGYYYNDYTESCVKTGWFSSVYCDIYKYGDYNPSNILVHSESYH